ncbi:efflux RND transporter periplasmic adaptor subunit [Rhodopirellula sp. P2]|uniref:efflux RND transporter periplasmic adaptor subunit n=1 Tax=Rhodopirellula sp. P2 TaxID=2127060 RepID=UPI00236878A9|nr:efflux RND transporter periplasmic adaptor subunit [Rhodopirellula sp. P2]WDQ17235.1 efflux RND transporter periplasmic adaptor subunit [Rhodopirellula sp. P2]
MTPPPHNLNFLGKLALGAGIGGMLLAVTGCGNAPSGPPAMPKPTVTVAQPISKKIVEWDAYTGRMEAVDLVEVRARVDGYLQSVHFDEGQIVEKNDLLFIVDPRPYEAELAAAQAKLQQSESQLKQAKAMTEVARANLLQSEAQLNLADVRYKRTQRLVERNASSQDELDDREAEFLKAKADVEGVRASLNSSEAAIATAQAEIEVAKAGVDTAELNLQYTRIRAPITGRISRKYVTEGNLIAGGTATSSLLTTIASVQPIYCVFDATEQDVLKYSRLAKSGERESSRVAKNPVYLGLMDEEGFLHQGHMDFVDNRFDVNTASMRARSVFANEDELLLPGMFARIRIPGSAPHDAVLIPDSAIGTDQSSQYVYVVVDGVIKRQTITSGPIIDGLRVIREGLDGTESLVIKGLMQSRPDAEVNTIDGTIEVIEDGLPDEYLPVPKEEWISPAPTAVPIADRRTEVTR